MTNDLFKSACHKLVEMLVVGFIRKNWQETCKLISWWQQSDRQGDLSQGYIEYIGPIPAESKSSHSIKLLELVSRGMASRQGFFFLLRERHQAKKNPVKSSCRIAPSVYPPITHLIDSLATYGAVRERGVKKPTQVQVTKALIGAVDRPIRVAVP